MNTSIFISESNTNYITNGNSKTFMKPVVNLSATGTNIKTLMKRNGISARDLQFLMDFPYIFCGYGFVGADGSSKALLCMRAGEVQLHAVCNWVESLDESDKVFRVVC